MQMGLEGTEYVLTGGVGIEECVPLLFELVFDGRWKEERLAREREIIASEIGLYGDDPEWVGYYSGLSNAYGNHPIAWEIAGDHSLLETFDTGFLKDGTKPFIVHTIWPFLLRVILGFEASSVPVRLRSGSMHCILACGIRLINPLSECPPCQGSHRKMG